MPSFIRMVPLGALVPATLALLAGCRDASAPTDVEAARPLVAAATAALSFRQISAGSDYSCGVTTDDRVYCWGTNNVGQLGNGTTDIATSPVAVSGGLHFRQVDAGDTHSCGVTTGDRAFCWGRNDLGQLGNGTIVDRHAPVAVSGTLRFRQVSAGQYFTCGITTDNLAYCWGYNQQGQLGDGSSLKKQKKPVQVNIGRRFTVVSAGGRHTCGVTTDNRGFCWGDGTAGQIGDGNTLTRRTPRAVAGGHLFRSVIAEAVSTSGGYSCGVTLDDKAFCWGGNLDGRLGDGTTNDHLKPVAVAGGIRFASVSLGERHTCGVSTGNTAYCWGNNYYGQLGDGGPTGNDAVTHLSPFPVVGGLLFADVSLARAHTCGVTTGGKGYCWGGNTAGQLGNGTTSGFGTSTPAAVAGPS